MGLCKNVLVAASPFLLVNVLMADNVHLGFNWEEKMVFQKGFSYVCWWNNTYLTDESDVSLRNLCATGVEWVSLVTTWYQDDEHSTCIRVDEDGTPTDASIIHAVETIHSLGMKVMLKPHVDLYNDRWRGEIWFEDENDWSKWFCSYKNFICHYARLAENNGVEQFCIGCELVKTIHREEWNEIIEAVRENFSGPITYAADWSNYMSVPFWCSLDFVGIDAYFWLTGKNNPGVSELVDGWKKWKPGVEEIHNLTGKPVVFTEIGYRSINGCNRDPWNWWRRGIIDLQEQADCYEAAFKVFYHEEWFKGFYWWMWESDPGIGGSNDDGYTPYGKPAEEVLKSYYKNISVRIEKPEEGCLYVFNREIFSLGGRTIVLGRITVETNVSKDVERVEFYVDGELKNICYNPPYSWLWDETVFGKHKVMVVAYNNSRCRGRDEVDVIMFNI